MKFKKPQKKKKKKREEEEELYEINEESEHPIHERYVKMEHVKKAKQ